MVLTLIMLMRCHSPGLGSGGEVMVNKLAPLHHKHRELLRVVTLVPDRSIVKIGASDWSLPDLCTMVEMILGLGRGPLDTDLLNSSIPSL